MPTKLPAGGLPAVIVLALLLPLVFSSHSSRSPLYLGLPRVHSGDEVHYLVAVNSVILDGDLDLANNYAAVHAGADQAGKNQAGGPLDHHTVWFEDGRRREWGSVFEIDGADWDRDVLGHPVPRLRDGAAPPPENLREFSTHPVGLSLLLAPVLYAFGGTTYVEPLAVVCSTVAIIIAAFMFGALARKYTDDARIVHLVTAVAFLGTPAWHYARTLFTEPYLLACAIGAYGTALRNKSALLSGAFVGIGLLLKPPFALLVLPLVAMHLIARDFRSTALIIAPVALSLAVYLALNDHMFGSPWTAAQAWRPGSFLRGAVGSFVHPKYGYLIIAPAIVVAIAAWPAFARAFPRDAMVLGSGVVLLFVLYASYGGWAGASSYAARHFVPLLPLVFVALVKLPDTGLWRIRWVRYGIVAISGLSVALNGIAAMAYWKYWDTNPVRIAAQWTFGGTPGG